MSRLSRPRPPGERHFSRKKKRHLYVGSVDSPIRLHAIYSTHFASSEAAHVVLEYCVESRAYVIGGKKLETRQQLGVTDIISQLGRDTLQEPVATELVGHDRVATLRTLTEAIVLPIPQLLLEYL